ncbi:hypothetical protein Tco_0307729 [Tanacetum coccineum]
MPAVPPPSIYEVGGPSTDAAEGQSFPFPAPGLPIPPSMIENLSSKRVFSIGEIGLGFFAIEGQAVVQQRDTQIQQLQTMVSEMSSRESTLMQCILGMDRRLADLERRPPGPQ